MESAAPQTPVQALEALQNAYSRFLDALPEARRASLGEAIEIGRASCRERV